MNARAFGFSVVLGVPYFSGCAPLPSQQEPQTGPPGVELEYHDRDGDTDSNGADPAAAKDDVESNTTEGASSGGAKSRASAEKASCNGLKKKDCEVMMGCAWSTDKVCVEHS